MPIRFQKGWVSNHGINLSLSGLAPQSQSMWIYPVDSGDNAAGNLMGRAEAGATNTFTTQGIMGLRFRRAYTSQAVNRTTVDWVTAKNTWQHICFTWDGTNNTGNVHIYVSGIEQPYNVSQGQTGIGRPTDDTDGFHIGNWGNGTRTFSGFISEAAIWNSVLTSSDILQLTSGKLKGLPLQIQSNNLRGYWPLDELGDGIQSTSVYLYDRSAYNNSGTMTTGAGLAESILSGP